MDWQPIETAPVAEVSSITGQSLQMVEHYAKQINKRRLAKSAIGRWENNS